MSKITRHIGSLPGIGSKVIVVFREVPDEPDNCLVILADSLPEVYRDAVAHVVDHRGQGTADLYEAFHAETMPTGENMLKALHEGRFLQKYKTQQVQMHLTRNDTMMLNELNEHLRDVKEAEKAPTTDIQKKFNPYQDKAEDLDSADAQNIAGRLLQEATDLRIEAERKAERALKLRPELREEYEAANAPIIQEVPAALPTDAFALMEAVEQLSELDSLTILDGLLQRHPMTAPIPTDVSDEDGKFVIDLREHSQRQALDKIKTAWREANPAKTKS